MPIHDAQPANSPTEKPPPQHKGTFPQPLPKGHPPYQTPLQEARELQRLLMKDARSPETGPMSRAQIARAWAELEERKRILRMKPKPKDVAVELVTKKRKPPPRLVEPNDAPASTGEPIPEPDP